MNPFNSGINSLGGITDNFGGTSPGGGGGGITYPPPTVTGDPTGATGLPGVPATPDVYPGTNTTMPPGTYPNSPGSISKPFNPWSLLPATVGGIGSIIGLARGQGSATDKALKAQARSTQPLQNVANQQLQQFSQNQLSPAQEAELKLKQDADKAKWAQYFADHGIPVSSSELNTMNLVDLQGLALKNQMLQQEWNNAYQGIGMARGNLADLARQQAQQDAEQRKAWSDFMAAMGKLGTDIGPMFGTDNSGGFH